MTQIDTITATAAPVTAPVEGVQPAGDVQTAAPTETPKPQLTARQRLEKRIAEAQARIEKDTAFVAEQTAKLDIIDKLDAVTTGWVVDIRVGRAETSRVVKGVVTGVDGEGDKLRYKVFYGEGFDAETVVIQQHQILAADAPAA